MKVEVSYKDALIRAIMRCDNNPYPRNTLYKLKLLYVQQIHDELMLSRGNPIGELSDMELESLKEDYFY